MHNIFIKQLFILIILLFSPTKIISQDTLKKSNKFHRPFTFNLDLDYNYQKCRGLEFGINFMTYNYAIRRPERMMEFGAYMSCEYNFIQPRNIFGPKLGIGIDQFVYKGFGYACKLNLVNYTANKTNDVRLSPELGFTFIGVLNIYYGYNIPLTNNAIAQIGAHKISINLNIGRKRLYANAVAAAGGM